MKSPFPGMDPYIEDRGLWGDFHHNLISEICRCLADVVSPRYLVRTGERFYLVLVGAEGKEDRPFYPDVSTTTHRSRKKPANKKGGAKVAETGAGPQPVKMRAFITEEHRESFLEIFEAEPEQRLVTTIEVLSPSNKRPDTPGWEQYQRKRQSLLLSGLNLVEIDLLRGGQRLPMLDPWPDSPYTLLVSRGDWFDRCDVWPAHFQEPLPVIPVPLAKPDPDIPLPLQPLIETIYQRSRYAASIDYRKPLTPPLTAEEMSWLKGRLRQRQSQT